MINVQKLSIQPQKKNGVVAWINSNCNTSIESSIEFR